MKCSKVLKLRKMWKTSQVSKDPALRSSPIHLIPKEALLPIKEVRLTERLRKRHNGPFDDVLQALTEVEYKRLQQAVPSVAKVKKVSKVTLLNEATLYIQRLHDAVLKKLALNSKIHSSPNFHGAMLEVPRLRIRKVRRSCSKGSVTRRTCRTGIKCSLNE